MSKYLFFIVSFFSVFTVSGQNPILLDPGEIELESELIDAMQFVVLEKYDDALELLRDIKDKINDDGIVEYEMSKIYFSQKNYDSAEVFAKKAMLKDNTKLIYKTLLTDILVKEKKYLEAAELMYKNLDQSYFDRKKYYRIADYYQRAKETDKAIAVLNRLEKKTGTDSDVELYKFNIYLRAKKYNKALKLVDVLLKKTPADIKILEKKALVYRMMSKEEDAEKVYKQILKLDPGNPIALSYMNAVNRFDNNEKNYILGLFPLLKSEKVTEDNKMKMLLPFVSKVSEESNLTNVMMEAAEILIKQYPESAKANSLMGDVMYNSGKLQESAGYYEKALKNNKSNYFIWKQLMTIYTINEDWKSLAEISEKAIDYYPNQVSGYYYAGRANIYLGKIEDGLEFLEDAMDFASGKYIEEIKLMQASGYIGKNKPDKATEILNSLEGGFTKNHPFYWELMGDLEYKKGDRSKAKEYWTKSLKLGNTTKRLDKKIRILK